MNFQRISIPVIAILLTVSAAVSVADITVIEGNTIRPPEASPVGSGTIYQLEVTPAREVAPAFKYRFTVPPHETKPGNAITHYLRAFGERGMSRPWDYAEKETDGEVQEWYSSDTPVSEIPLNKLRDVAAVFSGLESHIERAMFCRDTDWGIAVEDLKGVEMVGFLLPSVQETRSMARAMLVRNRLALIEKRYDDSIRYLRMTYRLGMNVNEMGFLVTHLIGVAETSMANDGVKLLIASEDSPNLYWALAELETPDVRRSLRLDSSMPLRVFPELKNADKANYAKDEWKRLLRKYSSEFSTLSGLAGKRGNFASSEESSGAFALGFGLTGYRSAKKRMASRGISKEKIDRMGVAELLLKDAAHDIKYFSHGQETSFYLPREQSIKRARDWEDMISKESSSRLGAMITSMLAPASTQVIDAGYRVEAEINCLMAIESLRNHAAIHGKFPESLDKLELPVRDNPFSGKPFNYVLEGDKAVLSYEPGNKQIQRYEITIKNK